MHDMPPFSQPSPTRSAGIRWNEAAGIQPAQSGVYLTRNDRDKHWFKFFDANYGLWYMSWAELKDNAPRSVARVSSPEVATQVVSWARCSPQQWRDHAHR